MFTLIPTKTYKFNDGLNLLRQDKKDPLAKVHEFISVNFKNYSVNKFINKILSVSLGIVLYTFNTVLASPSTGYGPMDHGALEVVKIFQAAIFWLTMLYSLRGLLQIVFKGEGEWKKVFQGFLICICDYLIPWLFGMIPGLFKI